MAKRLLIKNQDNHRPELTHEIPENGIITVGSEAFSTIQLIDENIAPEQFVIVCEDNQMTLLCRVNGTFVNGEILSQGALHILQIGDSVAVGKYTIILSDDAEVQTVGASDEIPAKLKSDAEEIIPSVLPEKTQSSLNDVLEGLRSEEKFYFSITNADRQESKIYVESEEMTLGWDEEGNSFLSTDPEEFAVTHAHIRKDWTGVVIYPLRKGSVWLNSEPLAETHRLKNGDQLNLALKEGVKPSFETVISFHEPTALMVLDSILPKELPPPIMLSDFDKTGAPNKELVSSESEPDSSRPPSAESKPFKKRRIFGYFTLIEILVMAIGTLITAALIFLILEFY